MLWQCFGLSILGKQTLSLLMGDYVQNFKVNSMAGNGKTGDNRRHGYVGERSQSQNPVTGLWTKRDTQTGQFMDVKTSGGKFKGVRKEK